MAHHAATVCIETGFGYLVVEASERGVTRVRLNGKALPVLWKPPFTADISDVAKAGENRLKVRVVNLWPNRMIGDEYLPEDSERNDNGTLKKWPGSGCR